MPLLASLVACLAVPFASPAQENVDPLAQWPAFRGPLGTGEAPRAAPPALVDGQAPSRSLPLPGHGKSTPIVWNGRVFLIAAEPSRPATPEELAARALFPDQKTPAPESLERFLLLGIDLESGATTFEEEITEALPVAGHHPTNGFASSTPVTDGELLVVHLGSYGVYAFDLEGTPRWNRNFGAVHTRYGWGEAVSPALRDGVVVVPFDQEHGSFLVALDARTGETLWRVERDEPTTWATPCIVEHDGRSQVVLSGTNAVRSYDLHDGTLRWTCDGQTLNAIPTPLPFRDRVICTSGYQGACCHSLWLGTRGDQRASEGGVAWQHGRGTPYVPSPALLGDRVYFHSGNSSRLTCLDANDGTVLLDRVPIEGLGEVYASPLVAAGKLHVVDREGTLVSLEHRDAELRVTARTQLPEGVDASPVAVGSRLLLRGDHALHVFEPR